MARPRYMRLQRGDIRVEWWAAEEAYRSYAKCFPGSARAQSLDRIDQRGGFGISEFACLYNGHTPGRHRDPVERDECVAKAFQDVGSREDRT